MDIAEILEQAKALSIRERKELVKRLVDTFGDAESEQHSILELAGLGADIWKDIDAQEYVNKLRSEWDDRR